MPTKILPEEFKWMRLVRSRGNLRLYVRDHVNKRGRYVVLHADGRVLEEFRKQKPATLWMKSQAEAKVPDQIRDGEICDMCRLILEIKDGGTTTPAGKFLCGRCLETDLQE